MYLPKSSAMMIRRGRRVMHNGLLSLYTKVS